MTVQFIALSCVDGAKQHLFNRYFTAAEKELMVR